MPTPLNISPKKIPAPAKLKRQQNQLTLFVQQGLRLHQQGKFKEAKVIYEKVLIVQKNHFVIRQGFPCF